MMEVASEQETFLKSEELKELNTSSDEEESAEVSPSPVAKANNSEISDLQRRLLALEDEKRSWEQSRRAMIAEQESQLKQV